MTRLNLMHPIQYEGPKPLPTWTVCVWDIPELQRRIYQIDMVDAEGHNAGSTNLDALAKRGVYLPDLSQLAHGRYTLAEIKSF